MVIFVSMVSYRQIGMLPIYNVAFYWPVLVNSNSLIGQLVTNKVAVIVNNYQKMSDMAVIINTTVERSESLLFVHSLELKFCKSFPKNFHTFTSGTESSARRINSNIARSVDNRRSPRKVRLKVSKRLLY